MTESFYLDIISGRRRGVTGPLLRSLLSAASPIYGIACGLRNLAFHCGWKRIHRAGVPVISIGNLTTGGTGKTPTVAWLVQELLRRGRRPAIVSRGYRSLDGEENDEKRLLDQLCAGVPHVQDRDRVAAARELVESAACDVIVLDDGFQHRRLDRDLDIVLIDAVNPWGFGRLLPRGLLREGIRHIGRADLVLMTRCDLATPGQLEAIRRRISRFTPLPIVATEFRVTRLTNTNGETRPLEDVLDCRVCAFCGIGNPDAFRRTLAAIGAPVSDERFRAFPDHHHYDQVDLDRLGRWAGERHAELLLTTRKDLVKIDRRQLGNVPVWGVDLELRFLDPADPLSESLDSLPR